MDARGQRRGWVQADVDAFLDGPIGDPFCSSEIAEPTLVVEMVKLADHLEILDPEETNGVSPCHAKSLFPGVERVLRCVEIWPASAPGGCGSLRCPAAKRSGRVRRRSRGFLRLIRTVRRPDTGVNRAGVAETRRRSPGVA